VSANTRNAAGGVAALAAAALLAGCSSSGNTTVTGVTTSPHASASSANGASPTPSPRASSSGSSSSGTAKGGAAGGAGAVGPYLPAKKGAKLPCNAQGLVVHLSQASGAVHGYLAKPTQTGATVIALKSSSATATGAKAAKFAANQLTGGLAAAGGCATTGPLSSVAKQTSAYLTTLAAKLSRSSATPVQVSNAEALIADVTSQAKRAGLTIVDRVPDPGLLARQG
jgi:hypothetical protein